MPTKNTKKFCIADTFKGYAQHKIDLYRLKHDNIIGLTSRVSPDVFGKRNLSKQKISSEYSDKEYFYVQKFDGHPPRSSGFSKRGIRSQMASYRWVQRKLNVLRNQSGWRELTEKEKLFLDNCEKRNNPERKRLERLRRKQEYLDNMKLENEYVVNDERAELFEKQEEMFFEEILCVGVKMQKPEHRSREEILEEIREERRREKIRSKIRRA